MTERPRFLIEEWLPTKELGIESRREGAPIPGQFPKLKTLHIWWARRPLVASAGAILASLLPAWSAGLANDFPDELALATESDYRKWFLRLCGVLGDPVEAKKRIARADEEGVRLGSAAYGYKQAFKNSPYSQDLRLLHDVLETTWGRLPALSDPTAGGGSIPYEGIRYGLDCYANDLNPISAAVLRAGVELPAKYGLGLTAELREWGEVLVDRLEDRLAPFFELPNDSPYNTYIWARTVACPRTGKTVPLVPNWWLTKSGPGTAVQLITQRDGVELDQPDFEIVEGKDIDKKSATSGTITRGKAVSPWDDLVIEGDYIKAEAQAGRMGSVLYAVFFRVDRQSGFRLPTKVDLEAFERAEYELDSSLPTWEAEDVLPDETIPYGNKTSEPLRYGVESWRQMFTARQLLVHGTFVEEYRRLIPEVRSAIADVDRADAVLGMLGLMIGKGVDWNSMQCTWEQSRSKIGHTFVQHAYPMRWSYAEFQGAHELYQWALDQLVDAYEGIAALLSPSDVDAMSTQDLNHQVPGRVSVSQGNAGDMEWMEDESVELVCIDPPYYDNVMYAELADFFYVWEKRTLGHLWPELFSDELTNKEEEAVKNDVRFDHAGRRKAELATLDYERKMTGIFEECRRILTDNGVMTVMFTHKKAEAWDTLGQSLLEAGFTIEASWPVPTESAQSLHQAKKNAASSTIFLVCRKRPHREDGSKVFFDSIESVVRNAARQAYSELTEAGFDGVDLLLATYGPVLSVISDHWPVYSSEPDETGGSRLLRPDEALLTAQEEVVRLERNRLVAANVEFDPVTDFWLLGWDTFQAREFPFDEARKLCLAVGGVDVDDLPKAKIVNKKSGTLELMEPKKRYRKDPESGLPGVNRERVSFPFLVDALHTAMYVLDLDGAATAKVWLDQRQLRTNSRFRALVEASVNAVPRVKSKGEFNVEEADLLERLVVAAFPDITIPDETTATQQEKLFE